MNLVKIFFYICFLITLAAETTVAGTIFLGLEDAKRPLGLSIDILEDPSGNLTFDNIISPKIASRFRPSQKEYNNFGFTQSVYWTRFTLKNTTNQWVNGILEIRPAYIQNGSLFESDGISQPSRYDFGASKPLRERKIKHIYFLNSINIPPGEQRIYHVRLQGQVQQFGFTYWSTERYIENEMTHQTVQRVHIGLLIVLIIYSLFFYFSDHSVVYLLYSLYGTSLILFGMSFQGLSIFIWPDSPLWANLSKRLFLGLWIIFGCLFTTYFLNTKETMPRIHRLFWMVIILTAACLPFALSLGQLGIVFFNMASLLMVISLLLSLFAAGKAYLKGHTLARLYFLARFFFATGAILRASEQYIDGILHNALFPQIIMIGSALEMILLALALADRLNLLKKEKETAQLELRENLESLVGQRTTELNQRTQQLVEANTTKDQFLTILAHDLRGPIGVLADYFTEHVKADTPLPKDHLTHIRSSTRSIYQLLEDLLTWSQSQKGELEVIPTHFSIRVPIDQSVELCQGQAKQKGIQILTNQVEPLCTFADQKMVTTVIRNLLENAIKFSHHGDPIEITTSKEDRHIIISIQDFGVGISEEKHEKLFKISQRITSLGTANEQGTGFGLKLCQEFILINGGEIEVESQVDQGSQFYFSLPAGNPDKIKPKQGKKFYEGVAKLNTLIVDDSPLNLSTSSDLLEEFEVPHHIAMDGEEALEQLENKGYQLIFMDIDLPGMSGVECARKIREYYDPAPKIIALSNYNKKDLRIQFGETQFDDYLEKPLNKQQLLPILDSVLKCLGS